MNLKSIFCKVFSK